MLRKLRIFVLKLILFKKSDCCELIAHYLSMDRLEKLQDIIRVKKCVLDYQKNEITFLCNGFINMEKYNATEER